MSRTDLILNGGACAALGFSIYYFYDMGEKLVFFPTEIGLTCLAIGILTMIAGYQKNPVLMPVLVSVHVVLLGILVSLGLVRMFQGIPNVLWIFTLKILLTTLWNMSRGGEFSASES